MIAPLPALTAAARNELITWILSLLKGAWIAPSGFPRAIAGDERGGDLMAELGDYVALAAAAGEREFALAQADRAFSALTARPLLTGLLTRFARPGPAARLLRSLKATHVQDYAEILLGFVELHQATKDPRPLSQAKWVHQFLFQQFGTRRGLASFWLGARLPLYEPLAGLLVESSLDYAAAASDLHAQQRSRQALDPYLENPVFLRAGLWPSFAAASPRLPPLPFGPFARIDLAKSNTALAGALLRAHQASPEGGYGDALRHFLDKGLAALQARDGGLHNLARVAAGGRRIEPVGVPSSANHAVIELLLDAHRALREGAWLEHAVRLGRFWMGQMHRETGLVPDLAGGAESFVDGNTDFAVVFRKIHDLTHERDFLLASETLVAAVARFHRTPRGLCNRTWVSNGAVSDATVETRYTALYLKPLLMPAGKSVWGSETLLSLLRDR